MAHVGEKIIKKYIFIKNPYKIIDALVIMIKLFIYHVW